MLPFFIMRFKGRLFPQRRMLTRVWGAASGTFLLLVLGPALVFDGGQLFQAGVIVVTVNLGALRAVAGPYGSLPVCGFLK